MCLQSAAPAWYARILSTVSAFHFSDTCYFTFKLGHQWRTEELFLHSNFLGWRKGALCIPSGGKSLPVYACVNFNDKYRGRGNHKVRLYWTAQLFKTKHALVPSFFSSLTTSLQGWSSPSFTTSCPSTSCFDYLLEEYQIFPVVSWCFLPCGTVQISKEQWRLDLTPIPLRTSQKVAETLNNVYSSAWRLLHEPEQKMPNQTISPPIALKLQ